MIKIHKFLKSLTKEEWNYLRLGIDNANYIWRAQHQFTLSDKEMVKRLGFSKLKFNNLKIGCHNYSLKDLAKLECLVKEEVQKTRELKK